MGSEGLVVFSKGQRYSLRLMVSCAPGESHMTASNSRTPNTGDRIRFQMANATPTADGRCMVEVQLSLPGGAQLFGNSEGPDLPDARVRAGADATVEALDPVLRGRLHLRYKGGRVLEAFDSTLVIVSLAGTLGGREYTLIGAVSADDRDLVEGGALAVLDAANRVIERFLSIGER